MLVEPITVDVDRERHLLFNAEAVLRAQREINKLRGVKPADHVAIEILVYKALVNASENMGILPLDLMGVMLWAACWHEDKTLTAQQAIEIVYANRAKGAELTFKLIEAWNGAWPEAKPVANGEDKKKSSIQTGSDSGALHELN